MSYSSKGCSGLFSVNKVDNNSQITEDADKIMLGKLIENVKVLAVKDRNGKHVFENSDEERVPSIIIFAVPEDMHLLLRKATYLSNIREISAELIPVPTTESYSSEPGAIRLASTALKNFIELNTGTVPVDELPPIYNPTEEQ